MAAALRPHANLLPLPTSAEGPPLHHRSHRRECAPPRGTPGRLTCVATAPEPRSSGSLALLSSWRLPGNDSESLSENRRSSGSKSTRLPRRPHLRSSAHLDSPLLRHYRRAILSAEDARPKPAAFYAAETVASQRLSPLAHRDNACSWTTLTPWPLIATSYVLPPR